MQKMNNEIDKNNSAPSRGNLLSKLYGRLIPESIADRICYPEGGCHQHCWYEVAKAIEDKNYPIQLELHCGCGRVIPFASQHFSELLLQILEDLSKATKGEQLEAIKASVPEQVIEQAWDMASDKLKRHCHRLCQ